MQNDTATNETKQNENTETPKNEKLFGYAIALSILIPIIVMGIFYWFYTQEQKTFEENISNITSTGKNNKNDIEELQKKTIILESSVKKLAELNTKLIVSLNNSIKMSEKFEKELRELTDKHQEVINTISDNQYYIIKKPLTPLPTKNTVTPPTAPSPTKSTVTAPTVPVPTKNTITTPTVPVPVKGNDL